eukprot:2946447-Amphidinium_carterae.1
MHFRDMLATAQKIHCMCGPVWHTAAGCSAHDIHNSVRWISGCVFQNDKLVLDNVHIAWACLRKGFYYAVQHLTQWLLEVLEPVGVDEGSRGECQLRFLLWGASDEVASVLGKRACITWDGIAGKLRVCRDFLQQQDCMTEFTGALLDLWRLPSSASRWMSIGCTCRHYMSLEAT